jgi:Skp family chaperone for outer membrane proteins
VKGMGMHLATETKTVRIILTVTAALALGVCGSPAFAQTAGGQAPAAAAPAPAVTKTTSGPTASKIAAINLRAAIASTAEGKQAAQQLETQFASRRKELDDLNKRISDLQQKMQSAASDDEKNKIQVEGQKLTRQLDRRQNEFQEDLNDAQNEIVQRIGRRIVDVIQKYAPSNGYVAVLDDSGQTALVMYASTDITQDIVKAYDQAYPAKSASNAPADSKPGTAASNSKPASRQ